MKRIEYKCDFCQSWGKDPIIKIQSVNIPEKRGSILFPVYDLDFCTLDCALRWIGKHWTGEDFKDEEVLPAAVSMVNRTREMLPFISAEDRRKLFLLLASEHCYECGELRLSGQRCHCTNEE